MPTSSNISRPGRLTGKRPCRPVWSKPPPAETITPDQRMRGRENSTLQSSDPRQRHPARQAMPAGERRICVLPVARDLAPEPIWGLKGRTLNYRIKFDVRCNQSAVRPIINVHLDG